MQMSAEEEYGGMHSWHEQQLHHLEQLLFTV